MSYLPALLPLGTLLAGGALLPAEPPAESYDLTPKFEEGQKLEISYELAMSFGLDDASASFGGMELPEVPTVDVEVNFEETLQEEVLALRDGALAKLRRHHASSAMNVSGEAGMMGQMQSFDESMDNPFDGRTLELTVDEDDELSVEDVSEGDALDTLDDSELAMATLETHFEAFLPGEPVEVGASWDVAEAMREELSKQITAAAEADDEVAEILDVLESLEGMYEFDATGRLASADDDEAVVEWSMEATLDIQDLFDIVREIADPEDLEDMPEDIEGTLLVEMTLQGTGVFDLSVHQLTEFEMDGAFAIAVDFAMSADSMDVEASGEFSGGIEFSGGVSIE